MSIEAMKQALEALVKLRGFHAFHNKSCEAEITALRQAIEQARHKLKPRCFADFQPNHKIDRKCQWCAVETECKTGITAIEQAQKRPQNCGTSYCSCIECVMEPEPVAWRNAALRVGEDLCSVGPFGYYDMTAEQWLDWALSVVTVHAQPPQRQPLTDEQRMEMWRTTKFRGNGGQIDWFIEGTRAAESAHGIKGEA